MSLTGLQDADGMAVDAAGNVYVTDVFPAGAGGRVLKLPAG
jgi:sugar lactone lactonase YvrE